MRLTTKGRFAVTAMIDLALREQQGPVTLAGISQRQKISLSYLEQLFGKLRRHELVESTRGPGGGYTLGRNMKNITVADIIFAVDEPLDATQCGGKENCEDDGPCMTHELWATLNRKMIDYLDSVTLASLVEGQRERQAGGAPRAVPAVKEHRAALEFPTSTLQSIKLDNGRLTTL
ncbi:MAG: Fe-S cluster assembly transcriptional regulator IscR [Burkholderiaceae bacterium]|nr:Fe-S cluster assembly transcriptional regulator IscR [Burkholderiaceae bacterium]